MERDEMTKAVGALIRKVHEVLDVVIMDTEEFRTLVKVYTEAMDED